MEIVRMDDTNAVGQEHIAKEAAGTARRTE
jgi:hypothetical protein